MRIPLAFLATFSLLLSLENTARAADTGLLENATNGATLAVMRVDFSRVEVSPRVLDLSKEDSIAALGRLTQMAIQPVQQLKELLRGEQAYLAIDLPYSSRAQARLLASTDVPEAQLKSAARTFWPNAIGELRRADGWGIVPLATSASAVSIPTIRADLIASQTQTWQSAMQSTSSFPVQLAIVIPEYVRETMQEIDLELPSWLGGGAAKTLISGVDWLSIGFDPQNMTMRLVVQTESAATAEAVKLHIPKLLQGVLDQVKRQDASSVMLQAILGLLRPTVRDSQVVLSLEDPKFSDAILRIASAAIVTTAQPMAVSQTQNTLKQLARGLHNYHSAFKALPTYSRIIQPKGLSWRVHILPFIDHAALYNEFHLDEAWDSPHNIRLLDRMPEIFKPSIPIGSAESSKPFHTTIVAPVGMNTVFGQDKKIDFQHITDGSSNTVIFVELRPEHAIPWTSSEEYPFDPADPTAKLKRVDDHVVMAFMDGSVRTVRADLPASVWNALFSRNGGESVTIPK